MSSEVAKTIMSKKLPQTKYTHPPPQVSYYKGVWIPDSTVKFSTQDYLLSPSDNSQEYLQPTAQNEESEDSEEVLSEGEVFMRWITKKWKRERELRELKLKQKKRFKKIKKDSVIKISKTIVDSEDELCQLPSKKRKTN